MESSGSGIANNVARQSWHVLRWRCELFGFGSGQVRKPHLRTAPAGCLRMLLPAPPVVDDFASGDCPKPPPERLVMTISAEATDPGSYRSKRLLADIVGVGCLQTALAAPLVDQWTEQADQPLPRLGTSRLEPLQQTGIDRAVLLGVHSSTRFNAEVCHDRRNFLVISTEGGLLQVVKEMVFFGYGSNRAFRSENCGE